MGDKAKLVDLPAAVVLHPPERLGTGFFEYERHWATLTRAGGATARQKRDIIRAGDAVGVLPVDLARDEIVLIRQFRLPVQLANGRGDLIEIVAGRVEDGEPLIDSARRECTEEIGVTPTRLVKLFTYFTSPGIGDETITLFLGAIDATQVREGPLTSEEGEELYVIRTPIDAAVAALGSGAVHSGPLIVALQWLALNRARLADLLG